MIADELIAQEIKKLGLEPIIQKHHLVPKFETWVSIKGVPRLEIDYTAYADCGVNYPRPKGRELVRRPLLPQGD